MYELLATFGKYIIILISLMVIMSVLILSAYQDKIMSSTNEDDVIYQEDERDIENEEEEEEEVYGSLIVKNIFDNSNRAGQKIDLLNNLTIGREIQNILWINDNMTSKYHAKVYRKGKRFYIQDLNSTNGTFVDGKRIKKATKITDGTIIQIGTYKINVQIF